MLSLAFDNSYWQELTGFYSECSPEQVPDAQLVYFNHTLAEEIGVDAADSDPAELASIFSGNHLPDGAQPIAQVYAGHQFGSFNPQLGDGRAHLLGEVLSPTGERWDIALKGSGKTPYSRGGDGKAAIGPMLREVLISEAMHSLGIPTTRSLAVVLTGEAVYRETALPGAVLTRVAASHLRIGTFQFYASRGQQEAVKKLADYTITRHYPEAKNATNPYLAMLNGVVEQQANLIAQWMGGGFIHGVMNTDNMSLAGETIDYGPCAFMDAYYPHTVFSSIDHHGRYAYRNQPAIAQWNLARFAEALISLIDDDTDKAIELATESVLRFDTLYQNSWQRVMATKLGFSESLLTEQQSLIDDWLALLKNTQTDFTLAHYYLIFAAQGDSTRLMELIGDPQQLDVWLAQWQQLRQENNVDTTAIIERMQKQNPRIIPRNHHVEYVLKEASENGNYQPFKQFLTALHNPYSQDVLFDEWQHPADPEFTRDYQTFCGT
ncbi:protein adenylyltransferase SelO [Teredinibacter sp. KSP-S5-2]|uniref:protein adenylyltransferase SelO n=1 Tax=Teredinibacter sp. KSP-S5-2 TaxID=3034506 RepID=UPI0029352359|nr:YdiU family protein [Teredinibacter sp. KSP-S5-2]WNO08334.1 YdiU family protein [Teredinibacter sp. KSP-S5-2]